jgi:hypothetical protein
VESLNGCRIYPVYERAELDRLNARLPPPDGQRLKCACCRRNVRDYNMTKWSGAWLCLPCHKEQKADWRPAELGAYPQVLPAARSPAQVRRRQGHRRD